MITALEVCEYECLVTSCLRYSGYLGFHCPGVVFLFTEFPLCQQIPCLFYFSYLRYFVTHKHTLGNLEVIIYFQFKSSFLSESRVLTLAALDSWLQHFSHVLVTWTLDWRTSRNLQLWHKPANIYNVKLYIESHTLMQIFTRVLTHRATRF
jgi:hypothetical protein